MSALPDKTWLTPADIAPYLELSTDTVRRSLGLRFSRFGKKLKMHREDFIKWEYGKREINGDARSSAANGTHRPSIPEQKPKIGSRQSSKGTSEGELESLLSTRSGRQ